MIGVFVYLGIIPPYIRHFLQQVRDWNKISLYLLTDDKNALDLVSSIENITIVDCSEYRNSKLEKLKEFEKDFCVVNGLYNREKLFYYSLVRLYIIEEWMRLTNNTDVFHMEIDNLLYYDLLELKDKFSNDKLTYLYEGPERGSAGFMFIPDVDKLSHLTECMLTYINNCGWNSEMVFMGKYLEENENKVYVLPIYPEKEGIEYVNSLSDEKLKRVYTRVYENNKDFENKFLFDSSNMGIWLGGSDPYHHGGLLVYKKNNYCSLDHTVFKYEWRVDDKNRKYPVCISLETESRIVNLHIHSKDLISHMSSKFKCPINRSILNGEKFQNLADVMLYTDEGDKCCVPKYTNDVRQKCIFELPDEYDNPKVIYFRGWHLKHFPMLLKKCKNPFVLIAHNADDYISTNKMMLPYLNDSKLISYFTQNLMISHPKANILPIGLANEHWPHGNLEIFKRVMNTTDHTWINKKGVDSIYFYFSIHTAQWLRKPCYDILVSKGLKWDKEREYEDYLREMMKYKYVVCPGGNGPDCHRFWEAVYLGKIPIVLYNSMIEKFRPYVKMVILNRWEDLDVDNMKIFLPKTEKYYFEDWLEDIKSKLN